MNRTERIEKVIRDGGPIFGDIDLMVTEILNIARPSCYMSMKDIADRTGRDRTTIYSWVTRNQHDLPDPLGETAAGMIWDGDEIEEWVRTHPELLR